MVRTSELVDGPGPVSRSGREPGTAVMVTVRTASHVEAAPIIETAGSTYADQLAESADPAP